MSEQNSKKLNKIRTVTKLESGSLHVVFESGQEITIDQKEELFQVFTVWYMLNPEGSVTTLV